MKPDCKKHLKDIAGIEDMSKVAEMIADLHYECLKDLLYALADKLQADSILDSMGGRGQLSNELDLASDSIFDAARKIGKAWNICKPFMS